VECSENALEDSLMRVCHCLFVLSFFAVVGCGSASEPEPASKDAGSDYHDPPGFDGANPYPESFGGCPMSPPELPKDMLCGHNLTHTETCTYVDSCPDKPTDAIKRFTCGSGGEFNYWRDDSTKYEVACPSVAPKNGDACPCAGHYPKAGCTFGACGEIDAQCDLATMKWKIVTKPCAGDAGDAGGDAEDAGSD